MPKPRKRDADQTKSAILEAATSQFSKLGYESATLRAIASEAKIDVALVNRYFGNKAGLFTEALKASFSADPLDGWTHDNFPLGIASIMADGIVEGEPRTERFQFLLRTATSPTTAPLLSVAIEERFFAPIRSWLGDSKASPRTRILAAVFIGLFAERLVRHEPLKGQQRSAYIERTARLLEDIIKQPG